VAKVAKARGAMEADLHILYLLLRDAAVLRDVVIYTPLSTCYQEQTGDWIDPHLGWRLPLETISLRCFGLFRKGHRPVLSAIVINNPEGPSETPGRPGAGFWGLRTPSGFQVTPKRPSEDAWVAMCNAVYEQEWPVEFDQLPSML